MDTLQFATTLPADVLWQDILVNELTANAEQGYQAQRPESSLDIFVQDFQNSISPSHSTLIASAQSACAKAIAMRGLRGAISAASHREALYQLIVDVVREHENFTDAVCAFSKATKQRWNSFQPSFASKSLQCFQKYNAQFYIFDSFAYQALLGSKSQTDNTGVRAFAQAYEAQLSTPYLTQGPQQPGITIADWLSTPAVAQAIEARATALSQGGIDTSSAPWRTFLLRRTHDRALWLRAAPANV